MSTTQHPLTETVNSHHDPRPWQDCTHEDIREGDLVGRLAWDLVRIGVAHHQDEDGDWFTRDRMLLSYADAQHLRRIPAHTAEKDTPMAETATPAEPLARTLLAVPEGHGAPHHDAGRIKAGDIVAQVDKDGFVRAGIAYHQDRDGDWRAENGGLITFAAIRADRPDALTVWPALTPPAEEVEWEPQFGDIIYDVEVDYGETIRLDRMVWTGCRWTYRDHSTVPKFVTAFTLPDGTRARRDGERADGEPRFVKTQEGEK